jgi:hypothetical protein
MYPNFTSNFFMSKNIFFCVIFILLSLYSAVAQNDATASLKDFQNLIGCWQGSLNYAGTIIRKPFSTTAGLIVKQAGNSDTLLFVNLYTKNAYENVTDTITISIDGRRVNNDTIKSKRYTNEGSIEIITEAQGFDHDNNKAAIVRKTYTIGKRFYTYKKQVQPEGETDWLDSEEFKYECKSCEKLKTIYN